MIGRRSVAVLALMVVLTVAPSLARAAIACAPHCCPAIAVANGAQDGPDVGDAGDDCRAGFANRTCCADSSAPLAAFAPLAPLAQEAIDLPGFLPLLLPEAPLELADGLRVPARAAEAERSLRTSPLRLSVVLLI